MSSRRTVAELLRALAAAMAERDLPWYLFGAQAAIIWGSPRLSADVDITATIDPKAIDSFVETREHGTKRNRRSGPDEQNGRAEDR